MFNFVFHFVLEGSIGGKILNWHTVHIWRMHDVRYKRGDKPNKTWQ